ncbi:hypothetical protein LRB11_17135, partial [Ectothiorhodospira haloalkaliphila]|uniref:hypothetical protein n=1 Tax=Ectothiorhodospira haloalkaliphila TaxID=421628 RepID=UPI001EE7EDC8
MGADNEAQVTDVVFADYVPVAGMTYTVEVNETEYSYKAAAGQGWDDVLGALETAIENGENIAVAVDDGERKLTLTADTAGTAFTVNAAGNQIVSSDDLKAALNDGLPAGFDVEAFEDDRSIVIQGTDEQTFTEAKVLTQKDGNPVGGGTELAEGVVREDGDDSAIELGAVAIENSEAGGQQPVAGVVATVEAEGSEQGINAEQVGSDGVASDVTTEEVPNFGITYDAGVEAGAEAEAIGEL